MLGTNTHFTLAVHILTVLALYEMEQAAPTQSATLAESVATNPTFLRKQVGQLKKAGFVKTKLGAGGGTLLAKDPREINLLDVYRLTEGTTSLQSHHIKEDSTCPVGSNIGTFFDELSKDLDDAIAERLEQTTIAALAQTMLQKSQKKAKSSIPA